MAAAAETRRQWLWRLLLLLLLFSSHLIFKFIQILLRVGGIRFGSFRLGWEHQGGDESALRIYVNYYGCVDLSSHRENNALIHSFNTNLTIIRYVPALVNCPVHIFNVDIITSSNYIVALATRNLCQSISHCVEQQRRSWAEHHRNELVITFSGDNRPFRTFLFLAFNGKLIRLRAV